MSESFVKHHGRVLNIDGPVNGTGYSGKYGGIDHSSLCGRGGQGESNQQNTNKASDVFVYVGLACDPLATSFYVPRNDTLVKIEGHLVTQSMLASEKSHGISWKCS
uniref:Transcription factor hy5 n=1 Tax=Solanum tuberosum TaxID=4113 RepID=M1DJI6_SOLTU